MGVKENRKQLAKRPTFRLPDIFFTRMRTCPMAIVVCVCVCFDDLCLLFAIIFGKGIGNVISTSKNLRFQERRVKCHLYYISL